MRDPNNNCTFASGISSYGDRFDMKIINFYLFLASANIAFALIDLLPGDKKTLEETWSTDWPFTGISTFAHLPYINCLVDPEVSFDIAILGAPFDTTTMYRPGARFGPRSIRSASLRQNPGRGFNAREGLNPYQDWAKVIDCGDIPITPLDNELALHQMVTGYENILSHRTRYI